MALAKYPSIELEQSFIAGDSDSDIELSSKLGIKAFGINVKTKGFSYVPISSLIDIIKYL
jgi:histidinol phosphatase-like enzyme